MIKCKLLKAWSVFGVIDPVTTYFAHGERSFNIFASCIHSTRIGVADSWYALWYGNDARDAAADRGSLGRPVFKRTGTKSGRVNRGWQGGVVRGIQESECVSYVIRMSMDAVKSPMENVHEVSGIAGKEMWIRVLLIERFMPLYALPKPPSLDKILSFYPSILQLIYYKHCSAIYVVCSCVRTYIFPTFIFIFYYHRLEYDMGRSKILTPLRLNKQTLSFSTLNVVHQSITWKKVCKCQDEMSLR